ncbi:MAG: LemA family protein [Planctomycetota bacterium]
MTLVFIGLGILGVLVLLVVVLAIYAISVYNALVKLKNRFENAFSQIEVQLKRRHDLIPNLVETAKGYMSHERETLEAVMQARANAVSGLSAAAADPTSAGAMSQLAGAEGALTGALGRLMAVVESYPDLKATENMQQLSEEMTTTENKVAFARQAYNDSATSYNTYRQSFPPVAFAGLFGHKSDASLLDFDDAEIADAPKVSF